MQKMMKKIKRGYGYYYFVLIVVGALLKLIELVFYER